MLCCRTSQVSAAGLWRSMKRSLRFPFALFLLLAAALSSRTLLRRRGIVVSFEYTSPLSLSSLTTTTSIGPELNETLLHLAAVDGGDHELRVDVDDLLNGSIGFLETGTRPYSLLTIWRRNQEGRTRPASRVRLTTRPGGPDREAIFPEFQRLLGDWFTKRQSFEPEVMSELLERVKRPIDRHYGYPDTGRPYATCAVVGNSGILLQAEHGDLIDGHDFVIRLNNARIEGYGRHVGAKTSLSFINSNILHSCALRELCSCHPYGTQVPIIFYICQPAHFLEYLICNASHAAPLLATESRFDALCARIVKYYSLRRFVGQTGRDPEKWGKFNDELMFHYSSGMQAIMVAVGICERVSVFGFGKSPEAKHHYHTNQKAELGLHDYQAEYEFYRDLAEQPETIPFLRDAGIKVPPVVFYH